MVTLYTITLTVACCVAVALVIGSDKRGRAASSSWSTPSTFGVLSAMCATLSTLAYAMSGPNNENIVPLVIGDVSMPLCIGLLLTTVRLAAGKRRTMAVYYVLLSLGVGATTLLVSPDAGQEVKLLALAALAWWTAYTCLRARLPGRGGWLIGGAMLLYGAYCLLRFSGPFLGEQEATFVERELGQGTSTIVAAITVAIVAWGVYDLTRQKQTAGPSSIVSHHALADWIVALLAQRTEVAAIAVSLPDLPLHRAAFGRAWAQSSMDAATEATRSAMPTGSVIGRVAPGVLVALQFSAAVDLDAVRSRLQELYVAAAPHTLPPDEDIATAGSASARPPDLRVELVAFSSVDDLRRFARRARSTARHALSSQGG